MIIYYMIIWLDDGLLEDSLEEDLVQMMRG